MIPRESAPANPTNFGPMTPHTRDTEKSSSALDVTDGSHSQRTAGLEEHTEGVVTCDFSPPASSIGNL